MGNKKCCAIGCDSKMNGKTAVTFHRFPHKDPARMKEWLKLCPTDLKIDRNTNVLCSKHFRREQYNNFTAPKRTLVHNAIPFLSRAARNSSLNPNPGLNGRWSTGLTDSVPQHLPPWLGPSDFSQPDPVVASEDCEDVEGSEGDPEEDAVIVQVNMQDTEAARKGELTTHRALILENITLKVANQELQERLHNRDNRIELLEKQVHHLSQLTSCVKCICQACLPDN